MTETVAPLAAKLPNAEEIALIKKFLNDTTLFLGPDPEIMNKHDLMPRSALEEECIAQVSEQMGAAPGAKWGDIITGVYSAAGDLAIASAGGVLIFSALVHHPIKFIIKN